MRKFILLALLPGLAFAQAGLPYGSDTSFPAGTPPNNAPVWNNTPSPGFVLGTADSYNPLNDVADADGDTLTFTGPTGCSFPTGVTLDSANKEIDYDGGGSATSVSSCVLNADDGIDNTDSSAFSLAITEQSGFAANTPSYTPLIPGAACFGCSTANWPSSGYEFYLVDSLSTGSTTGTFADALEGSWTGCRIVYFERSGLIDYPVGTALDIDNSCLIVAGQTAPSPGIVISGARIDVNASNVYLGHLVLAQEVPADDAACGASGDVTKIRNTGATVSDVVMHNMMMMLSCDENWDSTAGNQRVTYYQSISAWSMHNVFVGGKERGYGVLIENTQQFDILRSLMANNQQRNPLMRDSTGSMYDSVVYNHGKIASFVDTGNATMNLEGNIYITGPDQVNNEGIRCDDTANNNEVFFRESGTNMNRGLGGMSDPPPANLKGGCVLESAENASAAVKPAGYVLNGAGTTTSEEQAFVEQVLDCVGPRPTDRHSFVTALINEVLTYGTSGEIITDPSELPFTWPPTVAENSTSHVDLPGDADAAGSPINAGVEWVMDHSTELFPSGAGCN